MLIKESRIWAAGCPDRQRRGGREQNQITGLSARSDKQPQAWLKREQWTSREQLKVAMTAPGLERRRGVSECPAEGKGRAGAKEHSCRQAQEADTGASFTGSAQAAAGASLLSSGGRKGVSPGRFSHSIDSDRVSYAAEAGVK